MGKENKDLLFEIDMSHFPKEKKEKTNSLVSYAVLDSTPLRT